MSDISDWYKPLLNPDQKREDDLTVSDVFFGMDKEKQKAVEKLMTCTIHRYIMNPQDSDIVSGILHKMTDIELKVTHYLVGEALLYKEDIFGRLECWRMMRGEL